MGETESVGKKLAEALQGVNKKGTGGGPYTPLLKVLERLGMEIRVMPVMIGDTAIDCVVIPAQELLVKEYAVMSGVDPDVLLGDKTPPPEPEPANGQPGEAAPSVSAPRKRTTRKNPTTSQESE